VRHGLARGRGYGAFQQIGWVVWSETWRGAAGWMAVLEVAKEAEVTSESWEAWTALEGL
jgi:hypothetical protein